MAKTKIKEVTTNSINRVISTLISNLCIKNKYKTEGSIIRSLRTNLYFSEVFSINDLGNKKVNCVGANYICYKILKKIFPHKIYKLVSIKYPAFETGGHLSKHICVLETSGEKIRFIDATPMAGFYNGRISGWLDINYWDKIDGEYISKKEMRFEDFEKIYTYAFSLISEKTVLDILKYSFLKSDNNPERFQIKNLPLAWHAELLKDIGLSSRDEKDKIKNLKESYEISHNPFTYLKLFPNNIDSDVVKEYISNNKKMIKQIDVFLKIKKKSKKIYHEYLAVKYWKESAIKQLLGKKFEFKYIIYNFEKEYLYKIGKSYFKDNNLFLALRPESLNSPMKLSIISKKEVGTTKVNKEMVYSNYSAYDKLLLLMSPEVIIL